MRKKTLITTLAFSIGMSCQIGSAFAVPLPAVVGALSAINDACQFNNLGTVTANLCGGTGWIGVQCNLPSTPSGSTLIAADALLTLATNTCLVNSTNITTDTTTSPATITYCMPAPALVACLNSGDTSTSFTATQRFGGESFDLGTIALANST